MRKTVLAATLAVAALAPASAQAHVTLQPNTATAGGYTRLDVRVPTERDDASTNKVEVQFPDGFAGVSYEPVPGWSVKVATKKLTTPVQTDDGPITEGVDTVTWTADAKQDAIPPGAFQDFGLSLKIPDQPAKLTFKALQTYSDGQVVRWIGAEGSDHPAPIVTSTAAAAASATPAATQTAAASTTTGDDSSGNGLAIVALIVGALGLIVGVAGFATRRSRVAA